MNESVRILPFYGFVNVLDERWPIMLLDLTY